MPPDDDDTLYCICREPWKGRFMIQCDHCNECYHGSCVNISISDSLQIDKCKCENCKINETRVEY